MTKTNTKQRKQYTQAFKDSAVRLAEESGRGATSVARDLGIPVEYLYRWRAAKRAVSAGEQAFPGHGRPRDEEVSALKRENSRLRRQQEILKKALGLFTPASK